MTTSDEQHGSRGITRAFWIPASRRVEEVEVVSRPDGVHVGWMPTFTDDGQFALRYLGPRLWTVRCRDGWNREVAADDVMEVTLEPGQSLADAVDARIAGVEAWRPVTVGAANAKAYRLRKLVALRGVVRRSGQPLDPSTDHHRKFRYGGRP